MHGHILDVDVLNDVHDSRVLADAAHGDTVGAVTPEVLHKDVGGVWLWAEAVIADVHARVGHG